MLEKREISLNISTEFNWDHLLFFDIETMGFSAKYQPVRMITYLEQRAHQQILSQSFATTVSDESLLLADFIIKTKDQPLLIHYNGNQFDIPYMNERFSRNNMNYSIDRELSVDLYTLIKNNPEILLKKYKLTEVEKIIGYNRTDELSGKNWVETLKKFDQRHYKLLDYLFLHNREDVQSLPLIIDYFQIADDILPRIILINKRKYRVRTINIGKKIARVLLEKDFSIDLPILRVDPLVFYDVRDLGLCLESLSSEDKKKYLIGYGNRFFYKTIKAILENNYGGGTQI